MYAALSVDLKDARRAEHHVDKKYRDPLLGNERKKEGNRGKEVNINPLFTKRFQGTFCDGNEAHECNDANNFCLKFLRDHPKNACTKRKDKDRKQGNFCAKCSFEVILLDVHRSMLLFIEGVEECACFGAYGAISRNSNACNTIFYLESFDGTLCCGAKISTNDRFRINHLVFGEEFLQGPYFRIRRSTNEISSE